MSESHNNPPDGQLVDYYTEYAPTRFRHRNGQPLGQRSFDMKIHQFNLPVIRTGYGVLIDPQKADARLREFEEQHDRSRRKPGRPLKAAG
jgi:hypothetical protein